MISGFREGFTDFSAFIYSQMDDLDQSIQLQSWIECTHLRVYAAPTRKRIAYQQKYCKPACWRCYRGSQQPHWELPQLLI